MSSVSHIDAKHFSDKHGTESLAKQPLSHNHPPVDNPIRFSMIQAFYWGAILRNFDALGPKVQRLSTPRQLVS